MNFFSFDINTPKCKIQNSYKYKSYNMKFGFEIIKDINLIF